MLCAIALKSATIHVAAGLPPAETRPIEGVVTVHFGAFLVNDG